MEELTTRKGIHAAGLSLFRSIFGFIMLGSAVRFWMKGWIETIYIQPSYHFKYLFFEWVNVPSSPTVVYGIFVTLAVLSFALAIGFYPRIVAAIYFLVFTYVELWERSTYVNHYYFISILTFVLAWIPTAGYFSIKPDPRQKEVDPRCYLYIKILVSCVYFYAGIGKINSDWLLRGEPLNTWLYPFREIFTLWGIVPLKITAIAMSWGGMLFDTTVWYFLFNKYTRIYAFLVAVVFHVIVGLLFPIGIFPYIMVGAITIFFEPRWPFDLWERIRGQKIEDSHESCINKEPAFFFGGKVGNAILVTLLSVELLLPLRSFFYPGYQNWDDDGFAFSWRVMLVERSGDMRYLVVYKDGTQEYIYPMERLTEQQYHLLTISPDMMLEYAQDLGKELASKHGGVESITADSSVAYNGRVSQPYLNPEVNLLKISPYSFYTTFVLPFKG